MDSIQTETGSETYPQEPASSIPAEPVEVPGQELQEAKDPGAQPLDAPGQEPVAAAESEEVRLDASGSEQTGAAELIEQPAGAPGPEPIDDEELSPQPVDASGPAPTETSEPGQTGTGEMGELAVEDWDYQRPRRGEVRRGVILAIEEQEIIVDVDAKRDGIVPFADMQRLGAEAVAALTVGDEVDVFILRPEDQDGNLIVSLFQARQAHAWTKARELAESGEIWEGEVVGYNKGGLVIPVGDIRGFVPASQVPGFPQGLGQEERLRRLSEKVGETLQVKVLEINRRSRRLILSATAAQREWRAIQRQRLLEELREGEVRRGTVSSLCSFGAFVDLGGADGLVHLSELSWRRVRHPREAVAVGDNVEVFVLRLDTDNKRIGLSLKRLQPEPWALVEDKYELGQLVEGVVTNVVDFGAFAEIEDGVEGLIHISELSEQSISHPRDVVKKGDLLLLRIIRIDIRRKRLGLSLKRVLESEWAEWAARLAAAGVKRAGDAEVDESSEVDITEEPAPEEAEVPGLDLDPSRIEETEEIEEPAGDVPISADVEPVSEVAVSFGDDSPELQEPETQEPVAAGDTDEAIQEMELEIVSQ